MNTFSLAILIFFFYLTFLPPLFYVQIDIVRLNIVGSIHIILTNKYTYSYIHVCMYEFYIKVLVDACAHCFGNNPMRL